MGKIGQGQESRYPFGEAAEAITRWVPEKKHAAYAKKDAPQSCENRWSIACFGGGKLVTVNLALVSLETSE